MPQPPGFEEPWIQRQSALFGKEKKLLLTCYLISVVDIINTSHQTQIMALFLTS